MYFIRDKQKLNLSDKDESLRNDFQWVIQCETKSFSLSEDPNFDKGYQYLDFIHELTHYYQDLSICSCIGEHIYKTRVLKHFFDTHFIKVKSPITLTDEEVEIYNYIYNSSISIDVNSIKSFSEGKGDLSFLNKGEHFFPTITYKDLLECYAETKARQSIICETPHSIENHKYIYELLKKRHDRLCIDENGVPAVSFKYDDNGLDRYSIIRDIFLSFFHHCQPNKYKIYNTVTPNSKITVIDYLLFRGHIPVEESYDISNEYCISIPVKISPTNYLVQLERDLLSTILFALDVALTIPTTTRIKQLVKDDRYKLEDFHPCIRFYKIMSMFYKYPDYFNNIDSGYNWMSVFDDISGLLNWPSYFPIVKDISSTNKFFHRGNIAIYQDHFLEYHMNTTMESNNGAIFRMFRNMNIPIILNYPNFYVAIRYLEKNVRELVISDKRLYGYLKAGFNKLYSYTEDDEVFLQQIFSNKINMQLYENINKNIFKCPYSTLDCKETCRVQTILGLFNNDNPNCFAQYHIRKEILDFKNKVINNY